MALPHIQERYKASNGLWIHANYDLCSDRLRLSEPNTNTHMEIARIGGRTDHEQLLYGVESIAKAVEKKMGFGQAFSGALLGGQDYDPYDDLRRQRQQMMMQQQAQYNPMRDDEVREREAKAEAKRKQAAAEAEAKHNQQQLLLLGVKRYAA